MPITMKKENSSELRFFFTFFWSFVISADERLRRYDFFHETFMVRCVWRLILPEVHQLIVTPLGEVKVICYYGKTDTSSSQITHKPFEQSVGRHTRDCTQGLLIILIHFYQQRTAMKMTQQPMSCMRTCEENSNDCQGVSDGCSFEKSQTNNLT